MSLDPSSGWGYVRQIDVSDASNVSDDYQLRLRLFRGSGTDDISNGIIYLSGTCSNFPYDIRFGTTNNPEKASQLSQWVQTYLGCSYISTTSFCVSANQGVTTDGTYFWTAGQPNHTKIHTFDRDWSKLFEYDVTNEWPNGATQVNHLFYDNSKIYAGCNNYDTAAQKGWILEYDVAANGSLTFVASHQTADFWSEGCSLYNGDWWLFPAGGYASSARYDSNWAELGQYKLTYLTDGGPDNFRYQGSVWINDMVICPIHADRDETGYADVYRWNGSGFDEINRIKVPEMSGDGCSQGLGLEPNGNFVWWAERSYGSNTKDHRVVKSEVYLDIWVKLPSDNSDTIYLFTGNPDAGEYSSGQATFIFYDDFTGVIGEHWTVGSGDWDYSTNRLRLYNYDSNGNHDVIYTTTPGTLDGDYRILTRLGNRYNWDDSKGGAWVGIGDYVPANDLIAGDIGNDGTNFRVIKAQDDASATWTDGITGVSPDVEDVLEFIKSSNVGILTEYDANMSSRKTHAYAHADIATNRGNPAIKGWDGERMLINWFAVAKWSSNGPVWDTLGNWTVPTVTTYKLTSSGDGTLLFMGDGTINIT